MEALRAGLALYNAGHLLAAHEPWEGRWLDAPPESRSDCLQGLIQATAAIHKARTGNWSGAVGLAESAVDYLADCDRVAVGSLADWLARLAADPELAERERPPQLRLDGNVVTVSSLRFPALASAAAALAAVHGDDFVDTALMYAAADLDSGATSPLLVPLRAYVAEGTPIAATRLERRVEKRTRRDDDVEGLFD